MYRDLVILFKSGKLFICNSQPIFKINLYAICMNLCTRTNYLQSLILIYIFPYSTPSLSIVMKCSGYILHVAGIHSELFEKKIKNF